MKPGGHHPWHTTSLPPCGVPGLEAAMIPRNMLPCSIKRMARAELLCTCTVKTVVLFKDAEVERWQEDVPNHKDIYCYYIILYYIIYYIMLYYIISYYSIYIYYHILYYIMLHYIIVNFIIYIIYYYYCYYCYLLLFIIIYYYLLFIYYY